MLIYLNALPKKEFVWYNKSQLLSGHKLIYFMSTFNLTFFHLLILVWILLYWLFSGWVVIDVHLHIFSWCKLGLFTSFFDIEAVLAFRTTHFWQNLLLKFSFNLPLKLNLLLLFMFDLVLYFTCLVHHLVYVLFELFINKNIWLVDRLEICTFC